MEYRKRIYAVWAALKPMTAAAVLLCLAASSSCSSGGGSSGPPAPVVPPLTQAELIAMGEVIFFNEKFDGNGRTCGTCHPKENNFALDPDFINSLPPEDFLFIAEPTSPNFNPDLEFNFEKPGLMREFGLILENLDGFDNLPNKFVMRGVPHVFAQRTSITSSDGPRTGWSGDGSPGDRTLRSFATGAVRQHFTKTLNRVPNVDFRLPTELELDALEAFQLSLGRQQDLTLPLLLLGTQASLGQTIFLDKRLGKCSFCHSNAGATVDFGPGNPITGNAIFDTGIESRPKPTCTGCETIPFDDGFETMDVTGDTKFNIQPLVEAADSPPFFHNSAFQTIEEAVGFYASPAFNESEGGDVVKRFDKQNVTPVGIDLDQTEIDAVAAFLRVLNALENIRSSIGFLEESLAAGSSDPEKAGKLLERAIDETEDSFRVLTTAPAELEPEAVAHLDEALELTWDAKDAVSDLPLRVAKTQAAILEQEAARDEIVDSP